MNENQRRINRTLAGYTCSLMNDTKWREVLDLVGRYNQQVQFAFVRDETFLSLTAFPEGGTKGDCSTDCTAHGPFFLREIYALHCPLPDEKKDPKTGRKYRDETDYRRFIAALKALGQLPLAEDETGVTLYAYRK